MFLLPNSTFILEPLDWGISMLQKRIIDNDWFEKRSLVNISVSHDENANVLEALQIFTAAWKNLSVTVVTNS
jgi:hypothetical protein